MDTIPNNWQLIKIKYLFDEFFGGSWGVDPVSSQITGLVKVIRISEFEMNTLGLNKSYYLPELINTLISIINRYILVNLLYSSSIRDLT